MLLGDVMEFLPFGSSTSHVGDYFLAFLGLSIGYCLASLVNGGSVGSVLGVIWLLWRGVVNGLLFFPRDDWWDWRCR